MRLLNVFIFLVFSRVLLGNEENLEKPSWITIEGKTSNFNESQINYANLKDTNDLENDDQFISGIEKNSINRTCLNVKVFIEDLSLNQKNILDNFFRVLIKSLPGYVLFGDKPMCIKGYPVEFESGVLSGVNETHTILNKGIELWQNFGLSVDNKEYFFITFDVDYGYHHLICINRQAFLQAVNDNIILFRYALGPTLTAESLLKELAEAKNGFYKVLKDDNVLLGILLGYGKQNSLLVSRKELICDAFSDDQKEIFPFIAKTERFKYTKLPKIQENRPSIGFNSLVEERETIKKLVVTSTRLKPFDSFEIPYFGCVPESKETQALLDQYEQNRIKIIKTIEGKSFLEEVLTKLFSTTSNALDIPRVPKEHSLLISRNKEELISQLVEIIHQEVRSEKYFQDRFLTAFLEGIRANIDEESISEISNRIRKQAYEMYYTEQDLKRADNLERSDAYFKNLDSQKDLISLIPNRLYYKVLKHGEGLPASRKIEEVSFHYSFHSIDENKPQKGLGTVKEECIEYLIPGVAMALIGMKKEEEREIYIHPEYGYGENSYLPPNITIVARIQLVDFSERDTEVALSLPHPIERKNFKEVLEKYEELRSMEYYENGANFWNFIKKGGDFIDFETFQKYFNQPPQNLTYFENQDQKDNFLRDLQWYLLSNSLLKT